MKTRTCNWATLVTLCILALMSRGQCQSANPACARTFTAQVCGQETVNATQVVETVNIDTEIGQPVAAHLVFLQPTEQSLDIALSAMTFSGDLAILGILDVASFEKQNKDIDLAPVMSACEFGTTAQCDAAVTALTQSVSVDQLKKASIWWHGCVKSDDSVTKTFSNLTSKDGYVIAAMAQNNSAVAITATITHHANPAEPTIQTVCGPLQTESMPANGNYVDKLVGHISLTVPGANVSAPTVSVVSPVGKGSFAVAANGDVTFSGTVDSVTCPPISPPHHIPVRENP